MRETLPFLALPLPFSQRLMPLLVVLLAEGGAIDPLVSVLHQPPTTPLVPETVETKEWAAVALANLLELEAVDPVGGAEEDVALPFIPVVHRLFFFYHCLCFAAFPCCCTAFLCCFNAFRHRLSAPCPNRRGGG